MANHTIWGSGVMPGTQAIYTESPTIRCATSFYLNQDRTGWQCVGGRYYVGPGLLGSLTATHVAISVGNDAGTALATATLTLATGWNEVTWGTPLNISPVKSPFWIWSELVNSGGTGTGEYLAFNPPSGPAPISATSALFQQSAQNIPPSRAAYSIGGGGFLSNPASTYYSMDAIAFGPNTPPTVTVSSNMDELRVTDNALLTATVVDDAPGSTVAWTIQSGPNTSTSQFSSTAGLTTTFDPTALGTYVIRATVTDAEAATASSTISIPVIVPTALILSVPPNSIKAKDTDHAFAATTTGGFGPKSYTWSMVGAAVGVTLTNATSRIVTFRATTTGIYTLQCSVTDTVDSATASLLVRVTELPPPPSTYFLWDGSFWVPQAVDFL